MTITITQETMVLGMDEFPLDAALSEIALHLSSCAHTYFVERHVKGGDRNELKNRLPGEFGLTNRQYSGVAALADGKATAIQEGMKVLVDGLQRRIDSGKKKLKVWTKEIDSEKKRDAAHRAWRKKRLAAVGAGKKTPALPKSLHGFKPGPSALKRKGLLFKIHQKKRYLHRLEGELKALKQDIKDGRIRLCFGSRKVFRAQHNLAANGFSSFKAWRKNWVQSRASEIFCIGSKDEKRGSQTASWLGDGLLRLRVPPVLEGKFGKYLTLRLKRFRREGVQAVVDAIANGANARDSDKKVVDGADGLSWRLVRRIGKHGVTWVAQVSYEQAAVPFISDERLGAWGLDFNPDHIAMTRIDRFGNPVGRKTMPINLQDKTQGQIEAILGDAAAWAVGLCEADGVPLCAEKLDFREKKATLREQGRGYARMLSQFAYSAFQTFTDRRARTRGIEVRRVNPAFTSVIGDAKFGRGYCLSVHHAAGCAIARRGMRYSERVARRLVGPIKAGEESKPSRNAFPLPARTRGKHVWSDWRRFSNVLRMARLRANTAVDEAGGRERKLRTGPSETGPGKTRLVASGRITAMQGRTCRKSAKPFRWRTLGFPTSVIADMIQ